MTWEAWVLIVDLGLSALILFGSGLVGRRREYTLYDTVFGTAEMVFLMWLVLRIAS